MQRKQFQAGEQRDAERVAAVAESDQLRLRRIVVTARAAQNPGYRLDSKFLPAGLDARVQRVYRSDCSARDIDNRRTSPVERAQRREAVYG